MKQFRLFFAAAILVLATAGAFAKSAKFTTSGLYYKNGSGTLVQIDAAFSFTGLTTIGTLNQAKITSTPKVGTSYLLYIQVSPSTTPLAAYTTF